MATDPQAVPEIEQCARRKAGGRCEARDAQMPHAADGFSLRQFRMRAGKVHDFMSPAGEFLAQIEPHFLNRSAEDWRDGKKSTLNDGDAHEIRPLKLAGESSLKVSRQNPPQRRRFQNEFENTVLPQSAFARGDRTKA